MKVAVGKMCELMVASTQYAFSEERMRDETPLWMGVASTARRLFEDLVVTYARACIALGDLESLFENLFRAHDHAGIVPVYLEQFETFVLEHDVRAIEPRG